jgi:hypothetical protein
METTTPQVSSWLVSLGISVLVMFILYRRARRLFGRQKYSVPRLCIRIAIFGLLSVMLLTVTAITRGFSPWIGLAMGIGVGLVGFTLTRFESVEGELTFKPNAYVGIAVLSLLVGRMIYRLLGVGAVAKNLDAISRDPTAFQGVQGSPLTSGILLFVLGFYVCYYLAVLLRGQVFRASASE